MSLFGGIRYILCSFTYTWAVGFHAIAAVAGSYLNEVAEENEDEDEKRMKNVDSFLPPQTRFHNRLPA